MAGPATRNYVITHRVPHAPLAAHLPQIPAIAVQTSLTGCGGRVDLFEVTFLASFLESKISIYGRS